MSDRPDWRIRIDITHTRRADDGVVGLASVLRVAKLNKQPLSLALVIAVVILLSLSGIALAQTPVAPLLDPDDIATPTAIPFLLPTVTPTPASVEGTDVAASSTTTRTIVSGPVLSMTAGEESVTGGTTYTVRDGDTLLSVSIEIGIDLDDMPCLISPDFRATKPLVIGNTIQVPSGEITCHTVVEGDTIASIADAYHLNPEQLVADEWNEVTDVDYDTLLPMGRHVRHIQPASPQDGDILGFVLQRPITEAPQAGYGIGGPAHSSTESMVPANWPYGSGYFEWPAYGWISQGYHGQHKAVDIAAILGSIITSADRGVVIRAGWNNNGYGNFVVVDHNIDYITLYAHLDRILVEEGDVVAKGQVLGTVGSTGNSTGPHLHFEVRDFGARIDPLDVLVH